MLFNYMKPSGFIKENLKNKIHHIIFILSALIISCESSKNGLPNESNMVLIPGGKFMMGSTDSISFPDEYPQHEVTVHSFLMDRYEVTNRQFLAFVNSTGYVTTAERMFNYFDSSSGDSLLRKGSLIFDTSDLSYNTPLNGLKWWKWREDAYWKEPYGPGSSISDLMDHPVVHVSWYDANAYAKWVNKRLPTESEWEWAARGGNNNIKYPWGNSEPDRSYDKANLWQGIFPFFNDKKDGSEWTSKVGSYLCNGYGLYDMAGNVWEWCLDEYDQNAYKKKSRKIKVRKINEKADGEDKNGIIKERAMRGGSFLCDEAICRGYNITRRMRSTPDTGFIHTGFRCVKEIG